MPIKIIKTNQKIIRIAQPSSQKQIQPLKQLPPQSKVLIKQIKTKVIELQTNKQQKKNEKAEIKLEEVVNRIIEKNQNSTATITQTIKQEEQRKVTNISVEFVHQHFELKVPRIIIPKQLDIPKIVIPEPKIEPTIKTPLVRPTKRLEENKSNLFKKQLFQIKKCNEPVQLLLQESDKRKKYYSRAQREKEDIIHWGQRKLLISEMWFLNKYGSLSRNIIYAGAAPGFHIQLLSEMFPTHKFYLFDPNEFQVKPNQFINIYQRCFTNEEAHKFKELFQNDYLFISDIRTANYKQMTPKANEEAVLKDNELQMEWVKILRPIKCMLKFRCAYPTEIEYPTEFFDGEIYIQAWAPASSTETRLVPFNYNTILYDNVKYEEQLFYHNDVVRKQDKGVLSWDERAETQILTDYVRLQEVDEHEVSKQVNKIREQITKKLNYQ